MRSAPGWGEVATPKCDFGADRRLILKPMRACGKAFLFSQSIMSASDELSLNGGGIRVFCWPGTSKLKAPVSAISSAATDTLKEFISTVGSNENELNELMLLRTAQ